MVYPNARATALTSVGSLYVRQDIYEGVTPGEQG
jgi:hypothetical protein